MGPYYKNCCKAFATFDIDQLIEDFKIRLAVEPEDVVSISFTEKYFSFFDVVRYWFLRKDCLEGVCYEIVVQRKSDCIVLCVPVISGEHLCALSQTIKTKYPHVCVEVHQRISSASMSDTG